MYQNDPRKVLTGEVRLSYAFLNEPRAGKDGADPKYSVTLLIPKTDTATVEEIRNSMAAARKDAIKSKWNGVEPPSIASVLHDGDGVRQDGTPFGDECKGNWVLTASSKTKPQVVHKSNIKCELAPQDVYSGMYARVTVTFFGYNVNGRKGIGCALGNVMKTRDGDPLAGGASAAQDFAGLEEVEELPYEGNMWV